MSFPADDPAVLAQADSLLPVADHGYDPVHKAWKYMWVEADGTLHVTGTVAIAGPVTVVQPDPALLNCTEASGAAIAGSAAEVASAAATATTDNVPAEAILAGARAEDPASLPAAVVAGKLLAVLTDLQGILLTRSMLPVAGASPTSVVGVISNLPETKTTTYDVGMVMVGSFAPLVDGVTVTTAAGATAAVTVVGRAITQTVVLGASTKALLDAAWAANAEAVALCTFSCTAGTVANGYVGETLSLWTARTTAASASIALRSDGTYGPLESDAPTGATKVYQRGMNTAADAQQTMDVVPSPKGVNGPAVLLSNAALAEAGAPTTYSLPAFVANYDLYTVWIFWDGSAGGGGNDDTYSWDIFGRIDDQAVGDFVNVGAWGNTVGTALGGAAITGLTAWRVSTRTQLRELDIRRTKTVVGVAGTCSIRVWIEMGR